jgi:hypothetical protein
MMHLHYFLKSFRLERYLGAAIASIHRAAEKEGVLGNLASGIGRSRKLSGRGRAGVSKATAPLRVWPC